MIVIFYLIEPRNDIWSLQSSPDALSRSVDHRGHSGMLAVSNLAICLRLICCFESRMVSVLNHSEDCLAFPHLSLLCQARLGKHREDSMIG